MLLIKEITLSHEELADFYLNKQSFDLVENEYLLIRNLEGECVDKYRYFNGELLELKHNKNKLRSAQLGDIKPKDEYQECLIDALLNNYNDNNNIVSIKGKAGSGKSLFSLHYCFWALERGIASKIVIMVNPLSTKNSAKLGFYPGTRDEKLMDSFIGNMLSSKLGDRLTVTSLIQRNLLDLLPIGDIRGYETGRKNILYLPEAQNMDIDLLKLVLSRVGEQTKVIIDGDVDCQVDLNDFENERNGMRRVSEVFWGTDIYTEITLKNIYRSRIALIADQM